METCPKCGSLLQTGPSFTTLEDDETPDLPQIEYVHYPMICLNKRCENYAGENTSSPRIVVDKVKNRVN